MPFLALRSYLPAGHPDKGKEIGQEPTPAAFIDTLLALTAEWRRVLAPHGSICVELGDTYSGSGGAGGDYAEGGMRDGQPAFSGSSSRSSSARSAQLGQSPSHPSPNSEYDSPHSRHSTEAIASAYGGGANRVGTDRHPDGFTGRRGHGAGGGSGWPLPKSLCGIPHLYHLSLAYGRNLLTGAESPAGMWRVRNVVAWCRPNPPVGALGDKFRPATSYMTIATIAKDRYFDLDAVRSDVRPEEWAKAGQSSGESYQGSAAKGDGYRHTRTRSPNPAGVPPLDWWEIPTQPYKGSHYATYPEALCVRPIEAMCPRRVCTTCGKPSERIVGDAEYIAARQAFTDETAPGRGFREAGLDRGMSGTKAPAYRDQPTLGWTCCGHGDDCKPAMFGMNPETLAEDGPMVRPPECDGSHWRPGVVLDPFAGSGTTLAVATARGRDAIGIDLDERNLDLARERIGMWLVDEQEASA